MPKKSESRYIKNIKSAAKKLKSERGITQTQALDKISQDHGFENWRTFGAYIADSEQANKPLPVPQLSLEFVNDPDVEFDESDFDDLEEDENREISTQAKEIVLSNLRALAKAGVEFSIFEPTATGLKKSILDATQPVRTHFELEGFHNYEFQGQGPDHKVMKVAYFANNDDFKKTTMSLYRPNTKKGDPRMWFRGLGEFVKPGDQIAIVIVDGSAYLINLSVHDLKKALDDHTSRLCELITQYNKKENEVFDELLEKLKELAKTPLESLRKGDTGVGFTVETHLGIEANSSKAPDYNGIEIKSGRSQTRTTLFAQVPDWTLSNCKKSAEILDKYGYARDDDFKLYCTVSTTRENTQGLRFIYDQSNDQVIEVHSSGEDVAVWTGKQLRERLKEKHGETVWIQAESIEIDGVEHFQLLTVIHTKAPILSQLMSLIRAGTITMDHLIKRSGKTGRVSEKGPLFKINKKDLDLLFPEPVSYSLK